MMMKSMLFLAATAVVCGTTEADNVSLLSTSPSSCETDADCQASTNRCYFGRGTGGSCQCNPITNAGCAENEICSDRPTWVDGLPACVDPSTLGPIGTSCDVDEDCVTKRCFYGFQPPDTPGSCQCNSQTNAGCSESKICSDAPLAYDGSPECVDAADPDDLLPLGSPCAANGECQTGSCFFGMDPVDGEPGLCQCNSETNAGCADVEICLPTPGLLGSSVCVEDFSEEPPLPIGSDCFNDTQCASDTCWYGYQHIGSPGSCQCNLLTNSGCGDSTPICWDDPRIADEPPQCTAASLPLGSECFFDKQCASDSCWYGYQPIGSPGSCQCNLLTNSGCGDSTPICWDDPRIADEPPQCTAASLPLGSECFFDKQCASDSCFTSPELPFGIPGACDCNLLTNAGCDEGNATLCWDDPFIEDEPPACIDPSTLLPLFSECTFDRECASGSCFYVGNGGSCRCSVIAQTGCENEGEASLCWDMLGLAEPSCIGPAILLGIGDQCESDNECATLRCFQGNSVTKVCACNTIRNVGCPDGQVCSDEPTFVDGFPECREQGGGDIGDECTVNTDCDSLRCFYGEQLPNTPGTCACNSNSNAGCPDGQVCSDEPTFVDGFPECQEQGGGDIGDECQIDKDCKSNRCYKGRQAPGTPGSCQCNSTTNAGCAFYESCSDEPTQTDRLPECLRDENVTMIDIIVRLLTTLLEWLRALGALF